MKPLRLAVLASGRGSNLDAILAAIDRGDLQARVVVVAGDNPAAPALEKARARGIPAAALDRARFPAKGGRDAFERALLAALAPHEPDLVVLAGFMRLLGPAFLTAYEGRVINIHPALLPAFPGLHAQEQALDYGVKVAGCTVHFVDTGMDTGPIIAQRAVPVLEGDTAETLAARILEQEHDVYWRAVQWIAEGRVRVQGRRVIIDPVVAGPR